MAIAGQYIRPADAAPVRVLNVPTLTAPVFNAPLQALPRPDVYNLPIPTLPGLPVYRYEAPTVAPRPFAAAVMPAAVAVGPYFASARVTENSGEVRPAAPNKTLETSRRAFGLEGKKPDARRLQAIFDGTQAANPTETVVLVEEVGRPQTLPEGDLLREIGATPRR